MRNVSRVARFGLLALAVSRAHPGAIACPSCLDFDGDFSFLEEKIPAQTTKLTLPASSVQLDWPLDPALIVLNSQFGPRQLGSQGARYDWHRGIDFTLPIGTELIAPADAIVVHAGTHPNFADKIVQLRHTSQAPFVYTLYLHLADPLVTAGQEVTKGTPIALSGQGAATYPHLHWEVRRGCLRNECAENPFGYLTAPNNPPPAPRIVAAGDSLSRGRMLLLGWEFPKTEIDFNVVSVAWGSTTVTANLNALNALSPLGQGSLLDNPLWFNETQGSPFVFFPARFNSTFPNAGYRWLVWGLSTSVAAGSGSVGDAGGLVSNAALGLDVVPVDVVPNTESLMLTPQSPFVVRFEVTNRAVAPLDLRFEAITAQSIAITVAPESALLGPGASVEVEVSGTLGNFPAGVGDVVVFQAVEPAPGRQNALGVLPISTQPATVTHWWVLD